MKSRQKLPRSHSSLPIPDDLVLDIFSRLPVKTIAICRCVSKLWTSMLLLPCFTELFLTKSLARPQLLFASHYKHKLFFFSTPQLQNHDDNNSYHVANVLTHLPFDGSYEICSIIHNLVYFVRKRIVKKKPEIQRVMFNLSTRQTITIPKVKSRRRTCLASLIGYDPIEKQYKILVMSYSSYGKHMNDVFFEDHQVLTLGSKKMSWRMIDCSLQHYFLNESICINGILYYQAFSRPLDNNVIVCFDVRLEKFSFIKSGSYSRDGHINGTLVNYNGKLGTLMSEGSSCVNGNSENFELWVLEDLEKQEWSKRLILLPPLWKTLVGEDNLYFVGFVGTNQIVFSPVHPPSCSFNFFYYNIETKTISRVGIQGLKDFKPSHLYTFIDYVENVKML